MRQEPKPEIPRERPQLFTIYTATFTISAFDAPVAQLDRVSDFESEGRKFESCRVHQTTIDPCLCHLRREVPVQES